MRREAGILGVLCLSAHLFSPPAALAWSRSGHAAVGLLAERRLSPRVLAQVHSILGPNVSLADIASCADGAPEPACGDDFKGDALRKDWHTLSIPAEDSPTQASLEKYCQGSCVTDKINELLTLLNRKGASAKEKRVALIYLVHFVGDLHQPLHCVVARRDDGREDRWATQSMLTFMGWQGTLHWLWDNAIETVAVEKARSPRDLLEKLESDMSGKPLAAWTQGDVVSLAALESFQLSKETILPDYKRNAGRELGEDYRRKMIPVAYERLEKAGVRLAYLLNGALSAGTAPAQDGKRQEAARGRIQGLLDGAQKPQ